MQFEFIGTLIATMVLTTATLWAFTPAAKHLRLIDLPDDNRKLHKGAVPLTGGMSLFLALALVFFGSGLVDIPLTRAGNFWPITGLCLAILVLVHAIDDVIELRATTRFLIDALLAFFLALYAGVALNSLGDLFGFGNVTLGRYAILMTIFCFVASSNAFNMTDGIDCLCTGLGIICFVTLIIMISLSGAPNPELLTTPLWIVIASLIPMYLANAGILGPRMRIFLGDSGARLIAFIAAIALVCAAQLKMINPVMAYFPIAIPVCDCLVLMGWRAMQGRSPLSADRYHLHHLILDLGYTHDQTRRTIFMMAVAIATIGIGFQVLAVPEWIVSAFVVVSFWGYIGLRIVLTRARNKHLEGMTQKVLASDDSSTHTATTEPVT